MNAHAMPSAEVVRLPRRLRVVPTSPTLDRLVENGTIDICQHAAALAYAALRRRYERSGGPFQSWRDRLIPLTVPNEVITILMVDQ